MYLSAAENNVNWLILWAMQSSRLVPEMLQISSTYGNTLRTTRLEILVCNYNSSTQFRPPCTRHNGAVADLEFKPRVVKNKKIDT
jgi:hypothetical protein